MSVIFTFAFNTIFNFAIALLVARFLGPAEYGRFALASAVAVFFNTALFDWLRLSATRFYSDRTRAQAPQVRATLDLTFALIAMALGAGVLALILSGIELPLTSGLLALAVAVAVASGLFDYHTALVRARFLNRTYGRLILVKNITSLVFTAGGAWYFGSAKIALIGICLCVASAILASREALLDPGARPVEAQRRLAVQFMHYGLPIVMAGVLYQAIPLANRTLISQGHGFAETGQFSLAYDMGIRLVAAIGSTLDVLLFQIAVRADAEHGREEARRQIARNMSLVLAIVLPACAGFWLALPSFEALFVPAAYRGPFGHYVTILLPGLFAFAMMQYAVHPIFQIAGRTWPIIAAALAACAVNALFIWLNPWKAGADVYAYAQAFALVVGLLCVSVLAVFLKPLWPPLRDLAAVLLATGLMMAALLPWRAHAPGLPTLAAQLAAGGAIVLAILIAANVGGLRIMLMQRLAPLLQRRRPPA